MNKSAVIRELHAMMDTRLFSGHQWLADWEACVALDRKLYAMGLQERVPEEKYTSRNTSLGRELRVDLVMVFIGLWDTWEVPRILKQYALIDEIDELRLYDLLEESDDPEKLLGPIVRRAYLDHYQQSVLPG